MSIHKTYSLTGQISLLIITGLVLLIPYANSFAILLQGDEFMHIATVRESLSTHNYLLPQLHGEINYFKPPLLFWLSILSQKIAGISLLAARLPAIVTGILTSIFVFLTLRELKAPTIWPALAYLACIGTMKFGRLLMMEQLMALGMAISIYCFIKHQKTKNMMWIFLAGLVSALAYFIKGPLFQVYATFLFAGWLFPEILRSSFFKSDLKEKYLITKELALKSFVFLIPLLVPVLWNLLLYFNILHENGNALVNFFFVTENLGKFQTNTQPGSLLALGWAAYLMPYTVLILASAWQSFQSRGEIAYFSQTLILFAISATCLHLIPDRKDPYYIIPFIPATFIVFGTIKKLPRAIMGLHYGILFGVLALITMIAFGLETPWWHVLIYLAAILAIIAIIYVKYKPMDSTEMLRPIVSGVVFSTVFQFLFLPTISLPMVPDQVIDNPPARVCLISSKSWDGFALQAILPDTKVTHVHHLNPVGCQQDVDAIIELTPTNQKMPPGFIQTSYWYKWDSDITVNAIIDAFPNQSERLKLRVKYYENTEKK